jgi:hypothetical protein
MPVLPTQKHWIGLELGRKNIKGQEKQINWKRKKTKKKQRIDWMRGKNN